MASGPVIEGEMPPGAYNDRGERCAIGENVHSIVGVRLPPQGLSRGGWFFPVALSDGEMDALERYLMADESN